jgi:hypothetical protein
MWEKDRTSLQREILTLRNSTDYQVVAQLEKQVKDKQKLLDNMVVLLGKSEVKNLSDLQGLLKGKTLKELITQAEQALTQANQALAAKQNELKTSLEKGQTTQRTYQAKITELETQLLTLAKQKIANKKEAKELVTQLETNWKEKQTEWETQAQSQQETYATALAQTKAEHQEEIRSLKQKSLQEKNQAVELATQQGEQKLTDAKQVFDRYRKEQEKKERELKEVHRQEVQTQKQIIIQLNNQITSHQTNITNLNQANQQATETIKTHQQRITQLEGYLVQSQKDQQTNQAFIVKLNQDKINLQTQITNLTQTQTEQTRINNEQQQTLQKLRGVLTQLLSNRESELTQIETEANNG